MKNSTYVHKYLKNIITKDDVCVDMTMGNGNDTLFLLERAKYVYSFDIQELALINTKEKVKVYTNVKLIKDNHTNIDKYINQKVKLFIFNLGYLPNSDSQIITKKDDTLLAFKKAYDLLKDDGYIIMTFYLKHEGGLDEYYLLTEYFRNHNIKILDIYKERKKALEPITYIIKKF